MGPLFGLADIKRLDLRQEVRERVVWTPLYRKLLSSLIQMIRHPISSATKSKTLNESIDFIKQLSCTECSTKWFTIDPLLG